VALGPVVGGAVVAGLSWQWIFFLNVPIGVLLAPFAYRVLDESHGPDGVLDVRGLVLASAGLLALVWGIVRGNDQGWLSAEIVGALALSLVLLAAFVAWERRTPAPMLPLRLFRSRAFSATNGVSLIMNFGIFGSIFLLAQFLQTVQGYSAFEAGVRTLPWTLMPMFVAPLAGLYSDRIGSRPLMFTGLALQATALGWLASVASPTVAYSSLIVPFILAGIGMALVFAPVSNMILSSVRQSDEGKASGANNAIREVGGTLGVAVLASVFSREGTTLTGQGFVDGLVPAVWLGAVVLAAGALLADYNTSPVLLYIIPIWALNMGYTIWMYWEGLRLNAGVSAGGRRKWWETVAVLLLIPVFSMLEGVGGMRGFLKFARHAENKFIVIAKPQ